MHIDGQRKRSSGVGSAIRHSIPVRTFADWRDPPPGFFEIDMVEHCGGVKTGGDFVHTLTMTDIASGWTECVAMRVREQTLIVDAFDTVALDLPFAMLGVRLGQRLRLHEPERLRLLQKARPRTGAFAGLQEE